MSIPGRGERFNHSDHRSDDTLVIVNRIHDLWHPMSSRFRGEILDQESDPHRTQHGDQNDEGPLRAGGRMTVSIINEREFSMEQQIVEERNQSAERHCTQSCRYPHRDQQ